MREHVAWGLSQHSVGRGAVNRYNFRSMTMKPIKEPKIYVGKNGGVRIVDEKAFFEHPEVKARMKTRPALLRPGGLAARLLCARS